MGGSLGLWGLWGSSLVLDRLRARLAGLDGTTQGNPCRVGPAPVEVSPLPASRTLVIAKPKPKQPKKPPPLERSSLMGKPMPQLTRSPTSLGVRASPKGGKGRRGRPRTKYRLGSKTFSSRAELVEAQKALRRSLALVKRRAAEPRSATLISPDGSSPSSPEADQSTPAGEQQMKVDSSSKTSP